MCSWECRPPTFPSRSLLRAVHLTRNVNKPICLWYVLTLGTNLALRRPKGLVPGSPRCMGLNRILSTNSNHPHSVTTLVRSFLLSTSVGCGLAMRGRWFGGILEILSSRHVRGPLYIYLVLGIYSYNGRNTCLLFGMARNPTRETPFRCPRHTLLWIRPLEIYRG